jgi:hypothetical protein
MSFLSVFRSILHAAEAAASIAAPVVAKMDPVVGALMLQATNAAVGVEALILGVKKGTEKMDVVGQQVQATVDVTNAILVSQGRQPLKADVTDTVKQQLQVVIAGLNAVEKAVNTPSP